MQNKAIIFDLDGTILYTIKTIRLAINFSFTKYGYPKQSISNIKKALGKGGVNLLKLLLPETITQDTFLKIYDDYKNYYNTHPTNLSSVYSGVQTTLSKLKNNGYKLALISNKEDEITQQVVHHFFPQTFDFVTGARTNLPIKPAPDLVNLFLDSFNLDKKNVLYVGDSDVDLLTARNSLIKFIAVTWGYRTKSDLEKLGQEVFINRFPKLLKIIKTI